VLISVPSDFRRAQPRRVSREAGMCSCVEAAYYEALILAHEQGSPYQAIFNQVQGIVFLGTPHKGADLAALLSNILNVSFSQRIYVNQLRKDGKLIETLTDSFNPLIEGSRIELISFFESKKTRAVRVRTVLQ